MPSHHERTILPYTPQQLFDLVIDIERYPDFLPWCRAARILKRDEQGFTGELVISFHHLTESYTSRVTPIPPQANKAGSIDVDMVEGPFQHLRNHWEFIPVADGTEIVFDLDFKFRSRIMEKLIGSLFTKATSRMVEAFTQQAKERYGEKESLT
jgi:coenzyme Q-binding protein COQ10